MIQLCRPYLVIKTAQADLGLRFMTDIVLHKGRRVSDSELSKRLRYFEEMSRLNSELREEVGAYRIAS